MPIGEQVARRLIARVSTQTSAEDVASLGAAAAAYRACERVHHDILRWVGRNGSYALFGRAVAETRAEHPLLENIRLRTDSDLLLEGASESVDAHGAIATAAALESVLAALLNLLTRLIGDDVAAQLLEHSAR